MYVRSYVLNTNDRTVTLSCGATAARRPARRGDESRRVILAHAIDTASVDGLEGLTIGRLAEASGHSKSGVATLFGSKEQLQLATIAAAREVFVDRVIAPARAHAERGSHASAPSSRMARLLRRACLPWRLLLRGDLGGVRRPAGSRARLPSSPRRPSGRTTSRCRSNAPWRRRASRARRRASADLRARVVPRGGEHAIAAALEHRALSPRRWPQSGRDCSRSARIRRWSPRSSGPQPAP